MSVREKNRMLHILLRNDIKREHLNKIMEDLEGAGIFDEVEYEDDGSLLEQEADIIFSSKEPSVKIKEILSLHHQKNYEQHPEIKGRKRNQYLIEVEERLQRKQQELIDKGIVEPDTPEEVEARKEKLSTRYGRTPLHEAIAMRNLRLVKRFIKVKEYRDQRDNNGHTPQEMAYYENYKEALILFDKYNTDIVKVAG